MATAYVHRLIIIVPAADQAAANSLLTSIWPGGEAEAQTFGPALSANAADPATHYGCAGSLTDDMWAAVQEIFETVPIGWIWYRLDYLDHILLERSAGISSLNEPFDWRDALTDLALQVIEPEEL